MTRNLLDPQQAESAKLFRVPDNGAILRTARPITAETGRGFLSAGACVEF
jgi:hypothetical protein